MLRANSFRPPTFQQRQDFNFVQEHFRTQPFHSPNSSLWSATSPKSASSNTTPQRSNQTSSSNTSVSVTHVEQTNSLQPPRSTALSPSSFIPELRLPSSHPVRTRSTFWQHLLSNLNLTQQLNTTLSLITRSTQLHHQ